MKDKNELLKKLTSRKFLAALLAFAGAVVMIFFSDRLSASSVAYLEKGVTALCVYIGGESVVDAVNLLPNRGSSSENGSKSE